MHTAASILWSVSIEEQFYLTWPLVVKKQSRRIWQVSIALLAMATCYRVLLVYHHASEDAFWVQTFSRIDAICMGALLAAWLNGRMPLFSSRVKAVLILAGLVILLCVAHWGEFSRPRALLAYPAVAGCCGLMLVGALRDQLCETRRRSHGVRCWSSWEECPTAFTFSTRWL
jgi:peptidoglycan/LPS O-acetylase OafA/YrhL